MPTYQDVWGYTRLDRAQNMFDAYDHHLIRISRVRGDRTYPDYIIRSQTRANVQYRVDSTPGGETCTCPDFARGNECKHILLVRMLIRAGISDQDVGVPAVRRGARIRRQPAPPLIGVQASERLIRYTLRQFKGDVKTAAQHIFRGGHERIESMDG